MSNEVLFENINDDELRENITVFDDELEDKLCKAPDLLDVMLEQYILNPIKNAEGKEEIQLTFTENEIKTSIVFTKEFFEDYCFSTRKERELVLADVANQIRDKLNNKK